MSVDALDEREPAPRNLVFLIDVSGSMTDPDKLLVRTAMRMLADVLTAQDRVAIARRHDLVERRDRAGGGGSTQVPTHGQNDRRGGLRRARVDQTALQDPESDASRLMATVLHDRPRAMTANIGFASAVAEAGMLLRASTHAGSATFASASARAVAFRGRDDEGYRTEFIRLVELAAALEPLETTASRQ